MKKTDQGQPRRLRFVPETSPVCSRDVSGTNRKNWHVWRRPRHLARRLAGSESTLSEAESTLSVAAERPISRDARESSPQYAESSPQVKAEFPSRPQRVRSRLSQGIPEDVFFGDKAAETSPERAESALSGYSRGCLFQ